MSSVRSVAKIAKTAIITAAALVTVDAVELYAVDGTDLAVRAAPSTVGPALGAGLNSTAGAATLTLAADDTIVRRDPAADVFVLLRYSVTA